MIDIVRCDADKRIQAYGKKLGFFEILDRKKITVKEGGSDDQNRKIVEDRNVDVLMNPELKSQNDKLHYRKSGLNQVLAKIAKENDVAVGFGFSFLLNADAVKRAMILGRMKQNVRICRKAGVKMVVCSYANNTAELRGAKDFLAFARVIGMSGGEAKKSLNWEREKKRVIEF